MQRRTGPSPLGIEIPGATACAGRVPEQAAALLAWIGAVNERHAEDGRPPILLLVPR